MYEIVGNDGDMGTLFHNHESEIAWNVFMDASPAGERLVKYAPASEQIVGLWEMQADRTIETLQGEVVDV